MRRVLSVSMVAIGVSLLGCQDSPRTPSEAMTADLERDLSQLAKPVARQGVVSALELGANAPSGEKPHVRAAVKTKKPAPVEAHSNVVQTVEAESAADASTATNGAATTVAPVPTPVSATVAPAQETGPDLSTPIPAEPAGHGPSNVPATDGEMGRGRGDRGTGAGSGPGILTTIGGVIIRGGGVGEDHCKPRRRGSPGEEIAGGILGGAISEVMGRRTGGTAAIPARGPVFRPRM